MGTTKKWITAPSAAAGAPAKIAAGELAREQKRILPRLAAAGAVLVPVSGTHRFAVRTPRTRNGNARLRVDAAYVTAFVRAGLVTQDETTNTFTLSDLGRNWVARAAASVDPFRSQHQLQGVRMIDGRGAGTSTAMTPMRVNLAETPLGWLRKRKGADGKPLISETQFEAGEKLRSDFSLAQMTPRVTANWSAPIDASHANAGDRMEVSERAAAARQRFYRALESVGPGLAEPLLDVCCYLNGLEDAERRMGWPQRSGKVVLAIALERLADHYGFNGNRARSGRIGLWRAGEGKAEDKAEDGAR